MSNRKGTKSTPKINPRTKVSVMRTSTTRKPIAVVTSDWHLTTKAPPCREEEDWLKTQANYIGNLVRECNWNKLPLIHAGDIFDDGWRMNKCSPELINFAIAQFKRFKCGVYAIPGQHDLPYHRLEDITKSAFYTLMQSGCLTYLAPGTYHPIADVQLKGFPWNSQIYPSDYSAARSVAVVHGYCWKEKHTFPGSEEIKHADVWCKSLKNFGAAIFGDNHKRFEHKAHGTNLFNCGGFVRRKTDEVKYKPRYGILYSDLTFKSVNLEISYDKFLAKKEDLKDNLETERLLSIVSDLQDITLNFRDNCIRYMKESMVPPPVRQKVLEAIDTKE